MRLLQDRSRTSRLSWRVAAGMLALLLGVSCGDAERAPAGERPIGGIVIDSSDMPPPEPPPAAAAPCIERLFELWMAPLIRERCATCHVSGGPAGQTRLRFASDAGRYPSEVEAEDYKAFYSALADVELREWLHDKPTATIGHEGGVQVRPGSPRAHAIETMIALSTGEAACVIEDIAPALDEGDFVMLPPGAILRKAHRILGDRLPSAEQVERVQVDEAKLGAALLDLMAEDVFVERIGSIYEDMLLTQTYRSGANSYHLMRSWGLFPNSQGEKRGAYRWFEAHAAPGSDTFKALLYGSAYGFSRSAKELVKFVVRTEADFGQILTAPFTMVNAYSAHSYGVEDQMPQGVATPTTGDEPREPFFPVTLPVPTAGLLTDINFLAVYPTNAANLNRSRSREVNDHFLARDILNLSTRTSVSFDTSVQNPTYSDPACTVCHIRMDPIAGAFQNWPRVTGAQGIYDPLHPQAQARWSTEDPELKLLSPGFELDKPVPEEAADTSLQWLAKQIVADPRFGLATVRTLFHGLTGREPLPIPDAEDAGYVEAARAYRFQQAEFERVARVFANAGRDVRQLLIALLTSPLMAAADGPPHSAVARAAFGLSRMPGPVALEQRLIAATGRTWSSYFAKTDDGKPNYHWNNDIDRPNRSNLVWYREACGNGGNGCYAKWWSLLGGIDITPSGGHAVGLSEPNVVNAAVFGRMAHEMAWRVVAREFSVISKRADGAFDRRLFPHVDLDSVPRDEDGNPDPKGVEAIKKNIVHLHARILGESLKVEDPEVMATFALFDAVHQLRPEKPKQLGFSEHVGQDEIDAHAAWRAKQGLPALDRREVLVDTHYTVRAWRAVIDYLLSDYRFLYDHTKPPEGGQGGGAP